MGMAPASLGFLSAIIRELGGAVAAPPGRVPYVRWNFFTDLTITVGGKTWVRNGRLQ